MEKSHLIEKGVNYCLSKTQEVIKIFEELQSDAPLTYFGFCRIFDDGKTIDLSTSEEWTQTFYEKKLNETAIIDRIQPGINYLGKSNKKAVSETEEISTKLCGITNRLDLINRKNGFFDMYVFGANKQYSDKATNYYTYHQDAILKFTSYFDRKAQDIIAEGYQNKIHIPAYECPEYQMERVFYDEIAKTGCDLSFSSKEFAVLILYAGGATAKQIANMFNRSTRTIETHMQEIRRKTGNADRLSMYRYVVNNGWGDLIKFFFPYIQPEAA